MDRFNSTSDPFDNWPPAENSVEDSLGADNDNTSPHEDHASVVRSRSQVHRIGSKRTSLKGPKPLVLDGPVALPYPMEALGPLKNAAKAIEDTVQCPDAMAAHAVLGVASLATQGLRDVTLPHEETVPISLFLLTVGESGSRKSSADKHAMKGVREHEADLAVIHKRERDKYRRDCTVWEEAEKAARRMMRTPADSSKVDAELQKLGPPPTQPMASRIVVEDVTIEGLRKYFAHSQPSLGFFSEEGGTFLGGFSMSKEHRLKTCAVLSSFWTGKTIDHLTSGEGWSECKGKRLSLHIMAQRVVVAPLLADEMARGQGILARCLIASPKTPFGTRKFEEPSNESNPALDLFHARIRCLLGASSLSSGMPNEMSPPALRLSLDARRALIEFYNQVEAETGDGRQYELLRGFASKAVQHAARIAGVMTVYGSSSAEEIQVETVSDAIALVHWYLGEALRLVSEASVSAELEDAERIRKWLVGDHRAPASPWGEEYISTSHALQRGPVRENSQRVRKAFDTLEENGWLERVEGGAVIKGEPCREAWRIIRSAEA